jgi:hypothetical protein
MGNQVIALVLAPPACPDDKPPCENHSHESDGFPGATVCSLRRHHPGRCVSRGVDAATILDDLCTDPACRYAVVDLDDLARSNG